jgi:glycosyltransferase involved in cell wall biosynthesis
MRIFVFGTRGFPFIQGGVEKHCESLYHLLTDNYDIVVFQRKSFLNEKNKKFKSKIHFINLPSTKISGFETLFHSFLAACICIIKRPDIVHIHNIGPGLFTPLLRLFGLKVVLTYHSPNYEHNKWNKIGKAILKLGEKCSLTFANHIIFINKMQMCKYPAKIQKKSTFIANGIERKESLSIPHYINKWRLEAQKYILAVGRITPEKGFDCLIKAYKSLSENDLSLVIAGDSDHKSTYSNELVNQANKKIIFTGYITGTELQELYSFARLFVLPSYNEGYPLVLLEAINYNLPILASNIQANKQIGLPEKYYFPVGSANALNEKIQQIKEQPFSPISYAVHLQTWDDVAQETKKVYQIVSGL